MVNDDWIAAAIISFVDALDDGNYILARAIQEDVRGAGFVLESDIMKEDLLASPISKFTSPSPYQDL